MDAVVERQVYSEDGIRIGKVVDVVLLNSMVYGWLVKLSGKYECDKKVLIKKKNVKVVSDILIVDKDVEEHLKKFEKGRIYSILRALHLVKSKEEIAEIKLKEKIRIQSAAAEQRKIENERRVVKIYRTAANFKKMYEYMNADPRFSNVKGSKLTVIYTWAKKEFRNLHRSRDNGITVPTPYAVYKNVLVMEYIPAKLLLNRPPKDPEDFYERLIKEIKKLYDDAKLVHTDLSQYNILNLKEKPVLIDFSHAVDLRYPTVKRFVKRDMLNLVNYFNRQGLNLDADKEFERIWTAKN